jgi:hypothetical protein
MLSDRQINAIGRKILTYRALPEAGRFHAVGAKYRWFFGGNRSGKSEANIGYDLCSFALGVHPFRRTPRRAVAWAIAPTWEMVGKILWQEKIKAYLPAGRISGVVWHNKGADIPKELLLDNGNRIELKAFEQGRVVFQGRAIDAIYCDEQCEHDAAAIFDELRMRLVDSGGFLAWSATPLIAQEWLEARDRDPGPEDAVFHADLEDNRLSRGGYLADAEIDALIASWPEEVQETRIRGRFAAFLGAVYKTFRRDIHVVAPFALPADAERYRAIDLGFNNPFVCLWLARVGPDRRWVVYREHYAARESLAWHAGRIQAASAGDRYVATWADHDAQDVFELRQLGVETLPAKKDVRLGIELVQAKLKVQKDGRPQLTIFSTCPQTIREMIAYRWREGTAVRDPRDEPEKQHDHCPDALRYALYSVEGDSYFKR